MFISQLFNTFSSFFSFQLFPCIYPSIYPTIQLSILSSILRLRTYLVFNFRKRFFIFLPSAFSFSIFLNHPFIYASTHSSTHSCINSHIRSSIHPSIYLYIHPSIHSSIYPAIILLYASHPYVHFFNLTRDLINCFFLNYSFTQYSSSNPFIYQSI